jgi:CheY-like chemotaxis protein
MNEPLSTPPHISNLINILIADDDKDDALMLSEALQDILPSCNCITVPDGIAALRFIKTNVAPELVFLDLNMPLKNGHQLPKRYLQPKPATLIRPLSFTPRQKTLRILMTLTNMVHHFTL